MPHPIKKAVFPVAGLGTRFLPATKANPKEMLPIVDKPLIQYAVEEAIKAGINELIFVTSSSKRAIEDHFDSNFELEHTLEQRGQTELLNIVQEVLPANVSCVYIRQRNPLGLGHAVLCAKNLVGNEPFAVLLADDLIETGAYTCLTEMVACYEKMQGSVIAVEEIPREETSKYGIVALEQQQGGVGRIQTIVEKPAPEQAPSNLAVVGRYLLTPAIFDMLEETAADGRGEIQLTDAIFRLLDKESVFGYQLRGKRYDCGSKLGYLQATVDFALKHKELADDFKGFLQELVKGF
ncbi:MAG TPA: UTP--glucose-1-phosphate uridylyltransferase GalU [Gammaproteobacteria bacterium]|nr:UTP--glucose-1-phosphate uridylyltransferase GalU [Gammaproteobacteria bacterium]